MTAENPNLDDDRSADAAQGEEGATVGAEGDQAQQQPQPKHAALFVGHPAVQLSMDRRW